MTKNITLSAEENLIKEARKRAQSEHKSLNTLFREWLFRYAQNQTGKTKYKEIMQHLAYADAGRHFTRGEMNER